MGIDYYYSPGDQTTNVDGFLYHRFTFEKSLLTKDQLEEIKEYFSEIGFDEEPWRLFHDGIAFPDFEVRAEPDTQNLAMIVKKVLEKNPEINIRGNVYVSNDMDDDVTHIEIINNKVMESERKYTYTDPIEVEAL